MQLVNKSTPEQAKKYVMQNFSLEFLNYSSLEQHLQVLFETKDTYKQFQLKAVPKASKTELYALL